MLPIFKKGDKADASSYRPNSLTSVLCKVLEHMVASSLSKHFTELNLLFELQHGSKKRDPARHSLSCWSTDCLKL